MFRCSERLRKKDRKFEVMLSNYIVNNFFFFFFFICVDILINFQNEILALFGDKV